MIPRRQLILALALLAAFGLAPCRAVEVTLTWNQVSSPSTAGYRLHSGTTTGVYTQTTELGNTNSTLVSNLVDQQSYYFVVTAYNASGVESAPSNEISFTPGVTPIPTPTPSPTATPGPTATPAATPTPTPTPSPTPVPKAPSSLKAVVASSTRINLSWTDNSSNESGFKIERSTNGTTFSQIGTVAANITTCASIGLTASTKYYYRVRAYNSTGNSSYSNSASATTASLSTPTPTPTATPRPSPTPTVTPSPTPTPTPSPTVTPSPSATPSPTPTPTPTEGTSVATPVILPGGGTIRKKMTVTILCATSGATINYTVDGTDPTVNSPAFPGSIVLTTSTTIKARAFKTGYTPSGVATAMFFGTGAMPTPTPTATPSPTPAPSPSATPTPTPSPSASPSPSPSPTVTPSPSATPSPTPTPTPTPTAGTSVATPVIWPGGGTIRKKMTVMIACATSGATINYTVDGTDPTVNSTTFPGSIVLTTSTTIKARAFKTGYTPSGVATAIFTSR